MPGWIIQGVRGEGKSLAAVGKIREYMLRGCPVATNLDLYLEHLLPEDNSTLAYRLPDHPRLCDFQMLPPAYDPKYKGEDKNGLLVLDELGTWLNARNWNDKTRLQLLNWLFLSRKDHWDIILLAQDYEMIDTQVRTTLCDFLVQASRLDRQRIPYIAPILRFFGLSGMFPRVHRYYVYYGMSQQTAPVETWTFTGKDIYDGYDTNQKFKDGMEPLGGTLVDMRATYSYVPANYLTRHIFRQRLQDQIKLLSTPFQQQENDMAKKASSSELNYMKAGLLVAALVIFLGYRLLSGGFSMPKHDRLAALPETNPQQKKQSDNHDDHKITDQYPKFNQQEPEHQNQQVSAQETETFIDYLLRSYRPRLSLAVYSKDEGFFGSVEFYRNDVVVEQYRLSELHQLGVILIHRPYGIDMVYKGKSYIVTSWVLPEAPKLQQLSMKQDN